MHHVVVEQWSRRRSILHRRDARAKLLVTLALLAALATAPASPISAVPFALVAVAGISAARLPILSMLRKAAVVLPFSLLFALVEWAAGQPMAGAALLAKSYVSALTALLLVASTPQPLLLGGIESLGAPRLLVLMAQTLYRYLFVISEQAQHMRLAASCRQGLGAPRSRARAFQAAAGALAILFARSYSRAEGIQRAMAARGFTGEFHSLQRRRFNASDAAFAGAGTALAVLAHLVARQP